MASTKQSPLLDRITFELSRELEYFSEKEIGSVVNKDSYPVPNIFKHLMKLGVDKDEMYPIVFEEIFKDLINSK